MQLDLSPLQKAAVSLSDAIRHACDPVFMNSLNASQRKLIIAGVIQNFEFSYELSWKFIKRWLNNNVGSTYTDGVTRRELFRLAAQHQLIDDVDQWMIFHAARNQTSHTYNEAIAMEIFETSQQFVHTLKSLVEILQLKND